MPQTPEGLAIPPSCKARRGKCSRAEQFRVPVGSAADILLARQRGRELASEAQLTALESSFVATVISELAHNILQYAGRGEILLRSVRQENRTGVIVVAHDRGPGIADVERAMQDAFSTSGRLGMGLPGARRMMDEFEIVSHQNRGTTITAKKWAHRIPEMCKSSD